MCIAEDMKFDEEFAIVKQQRETIRAAQAEADVLYQEAMRTEPVALATKLLQYADAVPDPDMRAAIRTCAVMVMQFAVTRAAT
jgi:hypothetical protein